MTSVVCFAAPVSYLDSTSNSSNSTSNLSPKSNFAFPLPTSRGVNPNFQFLRAKATESNANQGTKKNSLVCADCDGNGAKLCTQCKGTGVNATDQFNGQVKAGALCWLCRGKKEILCGNCNGAGFLGGFMSTLDDTST